MLCSTPGVLWVVTMGVVAGGSVYHYISIIYINVLKTVSSYQRVTPHAIGVTRLSLAISCVQGVWRPAWHTPLSCSVSAAAMGPLGDKREGPEFS